MSDRQTGKEASSLVSERIPEGIDLVKRLFGFRIRLTEVRPDPAEWSYEFRFAEKRTIDLLLTGE